MSRRSGMLGATVLALVSMSIPVVSRAQAQPAPAGMIDITVFDDLDRNGALDAGEPAVSGVNIDVLDTSTGESGPSATTGVNGRATIADIAPGDYEVSWFDANGVDAGWTTPRSVAVTVVDGETVSIEFGAAFRTITGTTFFDINEDLVRDPDESPAPGVAIEAFTGTTDSLTTTGDDGTFELIGVGTFAELFVVAPPGFAAVAENDPFADFGGPFAAREVTIVLEPDQCLFEPGDLCPIEDLTIDIPIVPLEYDQAIAAEASSATLITGFTADITVAQSHTGLVNPNDPIRLTIPAGLRYTEHNGFDENGGPGFWDLNQFEPGQFEFFCIDCAGAVDSYPPLVVTVIAEQAGDVAVTAAIGFEPEFPDDFLGSDVDPTNNTASVDFFIIDRLPDTF